VTLTANSCLRKVHLISPEAWATRRLVGKDSSSMYGTGFVAKKRHVLYWQVRIDLGNPKLAFG